MSSSFFGQLDDLIDRSERLWRGFDSKPLFITGGTGFFGRWLLEGLVRAQTRFDLELDVTVLSRDPAGFAAKTPRVAAAPFINFLAGDVIGFSPPVRPFAYVIHGAATSARATFEGEDPLAKFDMAAQGARRVLDLAVRCRPERVLLVGSGSVYGGLTETVGAVGEEYPGAPETTDLGAALGHGKRVAEFLGAWYGEKHGLSISIARCFSFVGAFLPMDIHYAIGNFIHNALFNDEILVRGDGAALRSYLSADDLILWLLTILFDGAPGRIYNVGSDQAISIGDLAILAGAELAPGKPVRRLGVPQGGDRSCYVPRIERARHELGLEVRTDLPEAIRRTAAVVREEDWRRW